MNIGEEIVSQLLEESTPIIALYPGKFKPPHAGHFDVVAKAANIADKVIVIMSNVPKDEFTPEDSMKVWRLYEEILPNNTQIIISGKSSPVSEVFDIIKDKSTDFLVLYGKGEESRYRAIEKDPNTYSNVKIIDAGTFENLNATDLRTAIRNKDLEDIQKFLPVSIDAKKVLDIYTQKEFKPGPVLYELKSDYIQNYIKEDIETWGMLPEYKIDLNNVYDYKSENGFFDFYDDVNEVDIVVKLKKLSSDNIEFKFYPMRGNEVLGFSKLKDFNPKIMNTVFTVFQNEILPNYNNIVIQPAGYTRYRLFRAMINNYLDKNKYEVKLKDDIESPLILISKKQSLHELFDKDLPNIKKINSYEYEVVLHSIEESAKPSIKKRMENMNESYNQSLNYFKNGDIFSQSKIERNNTLKKYNNRKQISELYNIPFKTNILLETFTPQKAPLMKKFVEYACNELEIHEPQINIINSPTYSQEHKSFGGYIPSEEKILVVVYNRNMADILRTLAHELVHHYQKLNGDELNGEDGSETENEANARAGVIMRKFGREKPEIFEGKKPKFFVNIDKFNHPKTTQQYFIENIEEISLSRKNTVDVNGDLTGGTFTVGDITYEYSIKNIPNPYKNLGLFYNIQFTPRGEITSTPKGGKENYIKILSTMYKIIIDFIQKEKPEYIGLSSLDGSGDKNYHTVYNSLTTNNLNKIPGYFRKDSNLTFNSPQGKGRFIVLKRKDSLNEKIVGDKIECNNCSWSWDIKDGGDDLFICHKCGHDNKK